jgi:hypothetical protein
VGGYNDSRYFDGNAASRTIAIPVPESSWGRWIVRTVVAGIFYAAISGTAVWAVGDSLLSHALSGFGVALDATNKSVDSVRGEILNLRSDINSIGSAAVERFLQSLKETNQLEVKVTGDFANISQQLGELRSIIDDNAREQARLIPLIEDIGKQ